MIVAAEQPVRYGAKRMANSRAMVTLIQGPTLFDKSKQRWWLACFGNDSHYHKPSGICAHVELFASTMKPWYRRRTFWHPFGEEGGVRRLEDTPRQNELEEQNWNQA